MFTKLKQNQSGVINNILLLGLAVIVFGGLAFAADRVYKSNSDNKINAHAAAVPKTPPTGWKIVLKDSLGTSYLSACYPVAGSKTVKTQVVTTAEMIKNKPSFSLYIWQESSSTLYKTTVKTWSQYGSSYYNYITAPNSTSVKVSSSPMVPVPGSTNYYALADFNGSTGGPNILNFASLPYSLASSRVEISNLPLCP